MKINKSTILCLIFVILQSCNPKEKDEFSMNEIYWQSIENIKNRVLLGDTIAYRDIYVYYLDGPRENFFYWALIMANRYDYHHAHYDVFGVLLETLVSNDVERFSEIDSETRVLMKKHLKRASDLGNETAIVQWEKLKNK